MNLSVYETRKRHPRFIYRSYKYQIEGKNLQINFHFELVPNLSFFPTVSIEGVDGVRLAALPKEVIDNFVFHLGLMEIPSYWKAACSPEIIVETGFLDKYQINWWKDLLLKGLGEFFYLNNIDFKSPDFVSIKNAGKSLTNITVFKEKLNGDKYLLPIGGGKDSAVTAEIIKNSGKKIIPFYLNPIEAALDIAKHNGFGNPVIVRRKIDEKLLRLNKSSYLNGHTPFTAYLSFLSAFVAVLFDIETVLFSNARSSNEGNTIFNEEEISHQYSKSFEFEQKFRDYSRKYLATDYKYLSFLRPLFEIQIAKIFSGIPQYFPVFKSCNKNQKTNSWCQMCSKCFFVYTILYPFLDKKVLISRIFSEDLFEKKELLPLLKKFLVFSSVKPFDCVGTRDETRLAFFLSLEKAKREKSRLPTLLKIIEEDKMIKFQNPEKTKKEILKGWDENNFLTEDLKKLLSNSI